MKTYIFYLDGVETWFTKTSQYIKAKGHNEADKKAQNRYPGRNVMVVYTEV